VDAGRSRLTGGSGLGLAIVKHLLQPHGAELEIKHTRSGQRVICHFPLSRVQLARVPQAAEFKFKSHPQAPVRLGALKKTSRLSSGRHTI